MSTVARDESELQLVEEGLRRSMALHDWLATRASPSVLEHHAEWILEQLHMLESMQAGQRLRTQFSLDGRFT